MRLSIIALGHVHAEDLAALTTRFTHIEQLVLDIAPREELSRHRAELNRAIDAATADWMLIVRERETIDDALASEIAQALSDSKAWGFRIRSVPYYAGKPLHLEEGSGEVRLFHRRHYMRHANKGEWEEIAVQGSVVRLTNALHSVTFATFEEHRAYLAEKARAVSAPMRMLRFVRYAIGAGAWDANTLRYLWIEAAFK
ncbi:MAG TPA: hypothetical protein VEK79_24710 [Thermoanaerobaculia bacterium]|nr:hypothetical protein [Thermoanaerobaculia bacterium]